MAKHGLCNHRYNKDGLRRIHLRHDPTDMFTGGWFFTSDVRRSDGRPQDWLVTGMVFENFTHQPPTLIIVERGSLAEIGGVEAEEIKEWL